LTDYSLTDTLANAAGLKIHFLPEAYSTTTSPSGVTRDTVPTSPITCNVMFHTFTVAGLSSVHAQYFYWLEPSGILRHKGFGEENVTNHLGQLRDDGHPIAAPSYRYIPVTDSPVATGYVTNRSACIMTFVVATVT